MSNYRVAGVVFGRSPAPRRRSIEFTKSSKPRNRNYKLQRRVNKSDVDLDRSYMGAACDNNGSTSVAVRVWRFASISVVVAAVVGAIPALAAVPVPI
jgi:hypothetical protein